MILSVSRRTDIPAFYSKWFINRLNEGYVLVRNPMSYHQVSKISLSPEVVDCIVFWTKNAEPIIKYLDDIEEKYKFYFQYTINAYGKEIEPNIPFLNERIENFIYLSKKYGRGKVIWRYDPIFISDKYSLDWHIEQFEYIAGKLCGYTDTCVFSYIDVYEKNIKNLKKAGVTETIQSDMMLIAQKIEEIAKKYGISLKTCSENIDLSELGIERSRCIDPLLIEQIIGCKIYAKKDKNQRASCGCVESVDIGQYNTCKHECIYCYANYQKTAVENNILKHNANSPMLIGNIEEGDRIHERDVKSLKNMQVSLFDF